MRLLGIDYGTKRIGIALSDDKGEFAFPYRVVSNGKNLVEDIQSICNKESVGAIVIGESLNYRQKENPIMKDVYALKEELERTCAVSVHLEPEFLTTQEAKRLQGKHEKTHASAAALILQSYINRKKNQEL